MQNKKFDRRSFLRGGLSFTALGATGLLVGCGESRESFIFTPTDPEGRSIPPATMPQPPVLRSVNGRLNTTFNIDYIETSVETKVGERNALLRSWNGFLGGPTLRVKPGDRLEVVINNDLPPNDNSHIIDENHAHNGQILAHNGGDHGIDENIPHDFNTINLHAHGLHVSPAQDDVLLTIDPGESYTYVYDIPDDHPCGTFWYHAHKHGATAMHLFSGMVGLLIVEGEVDNDPEVAAATDLDFVIQELNLKGLGEEPPVLNPYEVPDYVTPRPFSGADSVFLVNGQLTPTIFALPGQTVRLRVLNGSARNTMPISIVGHQLHVISLDGITLAETKSLDSLQLAPANRADIIITIDNPGRYAVRKDPFSNNVNNDPDEGFDLAFIEVVEGPNQQMAIPSSLTVPAQLPTILPSEVTESRTLVYEVNFDSNPGPPTPGPSIGGQNAPNFTINRERFDANVINQTIELNAVVEWTLINTSPAWHSHHIHINPFQVFESSDGNLNGFPLTEPVWLDTVDIPPHGFIKARQRFPDFTGKFVLHCHVLTHEDIGMMQIVEVVPPGTPIPNPMIPPAPILSTLIGAGHDHDDDPGHNDHDCDCPPGEECTCHHDEEHHHH